MYAVIKVGEKQYRVSEGETVVIDKLEKNPGEKIEFGEILLSVRDGEVKVGQPTVSGAKVIAKVLEHFKGEKIRVVRFKAKVRYRRVKGFRPLKTRVKIEKIEPGK